LYIRITQRDSIFNKIVVYYVPIECLGELYVRGGFPDKAIII
jgi:hypothetical protein